MHANTCDTAGETPSVSQLISLLTTLNLHAGDICRWGSLLRGGQRVSSTQKRVWRRSSRRGVTDRPNAPRGTRVRPMLARGWPGWPLLGRCALPCAPCAWWLLHPVTVRSGAAGGHVETSCAACTNVSRRRVSAFGGVVQCRSRSVCTTSRHVGSSVVAARRCTAARRPKPTRDGSDVCG